MDLVIPFFSFFFLHIHTNRQIKVHIEIFYLSRKRLMFLTLKCSLRVQDFLHYTAWFVGEV